MNLTEKKSQEQTFAPVLDRESVMANNRKFWFSRRVQDIAISLLGFAILWPLMLVVALAIVIDSPGAGPIFSQIRVGKDGKEFRFYKFRSMKPRAEEELDTLLKDNEMDGPAFKMKQDPRITKVGRFIRKTGIDELPQL